MNLCNNLIYTSEVCLSTAHRSGFSKLERTPLFEDNNYPWEREEIAGQGQEVCSCSGHIHTANKLASFFFFKIIFDVDHF